MSRNLQINNRFSRIPRHSLVSSILENPTQNQNGLTIATSMENGVDFDWDKRGRKSPLKRATFEAFNNVK